MVRSSAGRAALSRGTRRRTTDESWSAVEGSAVAIAWAQMLEMLEMLETLEQVRD